MAKMFTKSILLPQTLIDALAREAQEKRLGFSELVRQALSERVNISGVEERLAVRLEAVEKRLGKKIDNLVVEESR